MWLSFTDGFRFGPASRVGPVYWAVLCPFQARQKCRLESRSNVRHAGDLCPIEEESVCQLHDLGKLDQPEGEKTPALDSCCQAEALESNNVSGGVLGVRSTNIMRRFAPPILGLQNAVVSRHANPYNPQREWIFSEADVQTP